VRQPAGFAPLSDRMESLPGADLAASARATGFDVGSSTCTHAISTRCFHGAIVVGKLRRKDREA